MNDLISKSVLIDALKVHFDSCFREDGELLYSDHICTSDDVVDLIKLVENQPTAYDIDKVVKELYEERTEILLSNDYECEIINYCIDNFDKAIKIVKQGGVSDASDNVCECRRLKGYNFIFKTSCGDVFDMKYGFKYCPYCGKKIKVVE